MLRIPTRIISFFIHLFSKNDELENTTVEINQDLVLHIMDKLSEFENRQDFLKSTSLYSLAKKLQTNPKYLSKIINIHYEKNFSSYINDLRMHYLLKELQTNETLKNYTVKRLAKKIGYGSTEAFSKTFKKHTGINPSNYLNNLRN